MRVAINGYGRIGRCLLRALAVRDDCEDIEVVAINELANADALVYLTKYDSTHGRFPAEVSGTSDQLIIETPNKKRTVELLSESDPAQLPWQDLSIDLLFECTGELTTHEELQWHLDAGVRKVLLSHPGESSISTYVMGVNDQSFNHDADIISAASCTSNALLLPVAVMHEHFGVVNGVVTTIHAAMHDQPVIDAYHSADLRKNRSASQSFVPVDTSLAAGVGRILPELSGCFIAHAIRVPVNNVSALNITLNLAADVDVATVNEIFANESKTGRANLLGYTEERLASCDFNQSICSSIIDANQTQVVSGKTLNLMVWFDNEWAYVNRMLDLALLVRSKQ